MAYIHYAAMFHSDGESMGLALAEQRGWLLATDDRRAIRVAQQAGLAVVSCPTLVKGWADAIGPDRAVLKQALKDIEVLAQFRPNPSTPDYQWWIAHASRVSLPVVFEPVLHAGENFIVLHGSDRLGIRSARDAKQTLTINPAAMECPSFSLPTRLIGTQLEKGQYPMKEWPL